MIFNPAAACWIQGSKTQLSHAFNWLMDGWMDGDLEGDVSPAMCFSSLTSVSAQINISVNTGAGDSRTPKQSDTWQLVAQQDVAPAVLPKRSLQNTVCFCFIECAADDEHFRFPAK